MWVFVCVWVRVGCVKKRKGNKLWNGSEKLFSNMTKKKVPDLRQASNKNHPTHTIEIKSLLFYWISLTFHLKASWYRIAKENNKKKAELFERVEGKMFSWFFPFCVLHNRPFFLSSSSFTASCIQLRGVKSCWCENFAFFLSPFVECMSGMKYEVCKVREPKGAFAPKPHSKLDRKTILKAAASAAAVV